MASSGKDAALYFTRPVRQVLVMLVVILLVAAGVFLGQTTLIPIIQANVYLNGVILAVFAFGVAACFAQVLALMSSISWIEGFVLNREGHEMVHPPRLMASMAALLGTRGAHVHINAASARSILDTIATRIDEGRDLTRYIVNVLIFLGLLGTFYGLATTVPAVVETIRSLTPQGEETSVDIFAKLIAGLETQLGGMGTAFASSLLGLAGSLVVGLLELFAARGQNRFYRELEDWISTITRVDYTAVEGEGGDASISMAGALLNQVTEQVDALQQIFAASDARNAELVQALGGLVYKLNQDTTFNTQALQQIAAGQEQIATAMRGGGGGGEPDEGVDAESRMRLRSIDVQLLRLLEEIPTGREATMAELRREFNNLRRTLRQGFAALSKDEGT